MDTPETRYIISDKKLKYPESVVKMSEILQKAHDSKSLLQETVRCENNFETETDSFQTPVSINTTSPQSSSSESSTPTGSPSSSINCSHSCGSLFGNCAKHRQWPLLQTFSNRDSPLSQQTFSNKSNYGNNNFNENVAAKLNNNHSYNSPLNQNLKSNGCNDDSYNNLFCFKREPNKTILRVSNENATERNRTEKKTSKNKVKFANSSPETREIKKPDLKKNKVRSNQYAARRHHSVPYQKGSLVNEVIFENNKTFNISLNSSDCKENIDRSERVENNSGKVIWGRSKSEDKSNNNKIIPGNNDENLKNSLITGTEKSHHHYWLDKHHDYRKEYLQMKCFKNKDTNLNNESIYENILTCNNGESTSISQRDFENKNNYNLFRGSYSDVYDSVGLKSIMSKINIKAEEWENKIDSLETEILLLKRELNKKNQENIRLEREVHKLRSILQDTSIFKHEGDSRSSLQDSHGTSAQVQNNVNLPNSNKKQGISAESFDYGSNHDQIEIQRFEKDFRSKQLIKEAIIENDFLKNLDTSQVREIVDAVYPMEFSKGDYVVREGEPGSHLYVSAQGQLEIIKGHKVLGKMGPGKAFGELAILYNCRRTASIKVVSDAKVWALDRTAFQKIMMKTGLQRFQENLNFLRSVPLLQSLSNEVLAKIADVLEVDFYPSGEHIIRQGASGDTFFIISSGSVKVTQQKPGRQEENEIRILSKGDYFGEQALLKEDCRTANVIALSPGVECLTLDRESFIQLIGDLSELQEKDYGDQVRGFSRPSNSSSFFDKQQEFEYIRLEDLDIIATIGVGAFARVELVQYSKNKKLTFALKCLKKFEIVETIQQDHAFSERNIMMACNSPFICRLYKTFKDSRYVYMLQEVLLGGEVHSLLKKQGCFNEYTTKFFTGCVIEAFEYLHLRGIIYRDLKPENLLMDEVGYAKLVDFGFSKRLGFSSKAWTFCGTPEYLAPEIILKKGHDRAVDYWSLGILIAELLMGRPPFERSKDPMYIYKSILKGIDMYKFPHHITRAAQNLIKKLCRDSPSERLGYQRGGIQDIKKHKWFQGFDWEGLKQRALKPPFPPVVRGPTDTSNFENYSPENELPQEEFSGWDENF